jgi:hypothetical protein
VPILRIRRGAAGVGAARGEDFRGLHQLKDRLGPRLEDAIILHTGEHAYTHDDWITVLPLDRLWASSGRD